MAMNDRQMTNWSDEVTAKGPVKGKNNPTANKGQIERL